MSPPRWEKVTACYDFDRRTGRPVVRYHIVYWHGPINPNLRLAVKRRQPRAWTWIVYATDGPHRSWWRIVEGEESSPAKAKRAAYYAAIPYIDSPQPRPSLRNGLVPIVIPPGQLIPIRQEAQS